MFGKTKVNKLYGKVLRVYENVFWLDVSVHDALLMEEFERITKLIRDVADFFVVEVPLPGLLNAFIKRY